MYKLMIADDEMTIREGIKCLLDWESLGFTIIGEASNGEDALKLIVKEAKTYRGVNIRIFCREQTSPTNNPRANGENSNRVALEKNTKDKKNAAYFTTAKGVTFMRRLNGFMPVDFACFNVLNFIQKK